MSAFDVSEGVGGGRRRLPGLVDRLVELAFTRHAGRAASTVGSAR